MSDIFFGTAGNPFTQCGVIPLVSSYTCIIHVLLVTGYAAIPAGGGGTFLGGYLVKRFNLRVPGIIKLCLALLIAVFFLGFVFLVHCQNLPFAGINVKYGSTAENK